MRGSDLFLQSIPGSDQYDVEEEIGHGTFSEVGSWDVQYTVFCSNDDMLSFKA